MLKKLKKAVCMMMALLMLLPAVQLQACAADTAVVPEETTVPTETAVAVVDETQAETVAETEAAVVERVLVESLSDKDPEDPSANTVLVPAEETQPQEQESQEEITSVPLYFQTDYPNNMYGSGSIADNGCGVTCLAMVATYLTNHEYLPNELARYFGGVAENNIDRLERVPRQCSCPGREWRISTRPWPLCGKASW